MHTGGFWPSNSWQTAACNPYQTHSCGRGQPSDPVHKLLLCHRRWGLHSGCRAAGAVVAPGLCCTLSIPRVLSYNHGGNPGDAGLLPQGGGLCLRDTESAQADPRCEKAPCHNPLLRSCKLCSLQSRASRQRCCTKASLPGAPRGFSWSEPPRGRQPGPVALWCCSAPRPQGQFGCSPAWSWRPLRSTAGNPWWRSCRSASSPAPPRCPALGAQDRWNLQAPPAQVYPTSVG